MIGIVRNIIQSVFPWGIYSLLINWISPVLSALLAIIVSVVLNYKYLKKGYVISWVVLFCLILLLIIGSFSSNVFVLKDPWILSSAILACIVWGSLIIKKPFTAQYAKELISKDKWTHPLFIKINTTLTTVWGVIFTSSFLLHLLLLNGVTQHKFIISILYVLSLTGFLFSGYYPKYARYRYEHKLLGKE